MDEPEVTSEESQTYRLEIRWDFTGTKVEAFEEAQRVASLCGGEVTDVMDEDYETVEEDQPVTRQA
jgi:hypothetical protein